MAKSAKKPAAKAKKAARLPLPPSLPAPRGKLKPPRAAKAGDFIENDCVLGRAAPVAPPGFDDERDARIWLVTGPNMAGKSTFLRQNALIVVLAQMGSFVPAASARLGLVSRVFSRVGAADDIGRGRSTFMVEMVETAAILNGADDRALVVLDVELIEPPAFELSLDSRT